MTGMKNPPSARAGVLAGCLFILAVAPGAGTAAPPPPATQTVTLAPGLPVVLDAATITRLGLFPDEPDSVLQASFHYARWGGVMAKLVLDEHGVRRERQRFLSWAQWQDLRARAAAILAGTPPPSAPGIPSPPPEGRTWPEVPLATLALRAPAPKVPAGFPAMRGRWMALLEAGVRKNASDFDKFFTPMGMIGVGFGYPFLEHAAAMLNFTAGFGNINGDFESLYGDGRSNTFSFAMGMLGRQRVSKRASFYAEVDGGYYIRSLVWGGLFVDPRTGQVTDGIVVEQQDWGYALRAGLLLQRRHSERPRFLDIGVSWQTSRADTWDFPGDPDPFRASGHDSWVSLSVRFWDGM